MGGSRDGITMTVSSEVLRSDLPATEKGRNDHMAGEVQRKMNEDGRKQRCSAVTLKHHLSLGSIALCQHIVSFSPKPHISPSFNTTDGLKYFF